MSKDKITTFKLLWKLVNEIELEHPLMRGTLIGNYAGVLDDRLKDSGHSRSTKSLKLYSYQQLQDELDERDSNE